MKVENIQDRLLKLRLKFDTIEFFEDGYEAKYILLTEKFADVVKKERYESDCVEKIYKNKFKGFVTSEVVIKDGIYTITLVPKTLEEMTDFVWRYVEKYGNRRKPISVLREAFCALEKAITDIPNRNPDKKEAKNNYEKFTSMVF